VLQEYLEADSIREYENRQFLIKEFANQR